MRRAERLFRILNEMRTRDVIRGSELAERMEVSLSTIYRDIAHLQASGLPIEGEAGIGYLLRPGFELPNMTFTHDQVDALAIGLAFVERTGDPMLATAAQEARAKIQAGLPNPEDRKLADAPFYSLQIQNSAPPTVSLVREAIRQRLIVEIDYRDGEGQSSERSVRPLVLWNLTDGWMFSAWCELRRDFRTFRFDRIEKLAVTGTVFEDDDTKGLRAFLATEPCEGD
ncbi:helix-turn-helix transcriptional regulator [Roseibium sediminicola]|uniref:YafY family transcriptional regulator n=1 Tax=Roseibium sediminicola TaxID=2933272 RepID=A0ABT0GUP9_9HYPH|nr:YafY family protein [Roseibium sp. CAU 1639]MCK7613147.1 YafY family transcriptional regulator [Roseibium sp. CAU 1639]